MAKELKLRRGTTAEHATFTGAEGEVTIDTTKDTAVVHDGVTAGGIPLAKEADIPTGALASLNEVDASTIADNSVGAAELNVSGNGSAGQFLSSDGDGTMTWADVGGGAIIKHQLFTSPGTWTKPANTNWATATVIGGGGGINVANWPGGGNPGGTSSFGGLVVATGGTRSLQPNSGNAYGASGSGTVNAGQAISTSSVDGNIPSAGFIARSNTGAAAVGYIHGGTRGFPGANTTDYSVGNSQMAGTGMTAGNTANSFAGFGGVAVGSVPVSNPQSVTIGAGGNGGGPTKDNTSCGGAVVVEWVE